MRKKLKLHGGFAPGVQTVKVTQIEAAVRQLVQAIELFFQEKDPISIHSLVRNAEEILSTILRTKGLSSIWTTLLNAARPELREKLQTKIDNARNALKHRMVDETDLIEFPIEANELFIFIGTHAVHKYWPQLFTQHPILLLFEGWYIVNHPGVIDETSPEATRVKWIASMGGIKTISKQEYYNELYEVAAAALRDAKAEPLPSV